MLSDHKVAQLNLMQIKESAIAWRARIFGTRDGSIRAANAIVWMTKNKVVRGELLKLVMSSKDKIGAPAVVSYKPLKIEFDRTQWTKALLSKDSLSNYIAGHEVGHIVLHGSDAQPYSGVRKAWISFDQDSAEWQANTFADQFLVLDSDVVQYISPDVIAAECQVPLDAAERRFLELAKKGQCCCEYCFSSKTYRLNTDHFCQTCRRCF